MRGDCVVAYLKYYADSAETRAVELWYLTTVSWVQSQGTLRGIVGGQNSPTRSCFSLSALRFSHENLSLILSFLYFKDSTIYIDEDCTSGCTLVQPRRNKGTLLATAWRSQKKDVTSQDGSHGCWLGIPGWDARIATVLPTRTSFKHGAITSWKHEIHTNNT